MGEIRLVKEGKYIYCIIPLGEPKAFGSLGIGGRGDELYAVCFNGIAAVVSNSPVVDYPISRENLIAHEKAIEEVMKEYTVLPVRFATIAEDEAKIRKILEKEHDRFKDLLGKIANKKELGLKAIFEEKAIYDDILERYEYIKTAKEKIVKLPPDKTYYQRAQIGEMVEEALGKERERYKQEMLNILSPLASEVKDNATYGERMIINAAFLVNKDKETEFDQKVNKLEEKYDDKIKFKYVGTLPPFNFVNLVIETKKY